MTGKALQGGGRLGFAGIETRILHLPMAEPTEESPVPEVVEAAAEAGFNAVALTACESGRVCWPDPPRERRPRQWPEQAAGLRDLLPEFCSAASQAGLLVYAAVPLLSLDESRHAVPRLLRRWQAELDESDARTDDIPHLCSNRPEVCRFLGNVLSELVSAYPVDGVILSAYARPGQFDAPERSLCRCAACCEAVDQSLLFDLHKMTVDPGDDRYRRWSEWQVTRIGDFLEGLICRMTAVRRGLRVLLDVPPEAESHAVVREWLEQGLAHGAIHHGAPSDAASSRALLRLLCSDVKWTDDLRPLGDHAPALQSDGVVARASSWPLADAVMRFQSAFKGPALPAERDPVASVIALLDSAGLDRRRGSEAGALRHVREVLDSADARQPEMLADLASDCWHASAGAADDLADAAGAAARLLQLAALL